MSATLTKANTKSRGKTVKVGATARPAGPEPATGVPVPRVRATAGERAVQRLASLIAMAGDPTRLRILNLLAAAGDESVGAMAQRLGVTQPALSHHLALMRSSDVIEARRTGKENRYSLAPKGEILVRFAAELGAAE